MCRCLLKFGLPIFLFYVGFILLSTLIGLIIGLLTSTIIISSVIGFFIGIALAIITNAIVLIIATKFCYKKESFCC